MNFPDFNLQSTSGNRRSVLPQGPVETGKVKDRPCKRPSVRHRAALSFSRVSRGAGLMGFFIGIMPRIKTERSKTERSKAPRDFILAKAILEGLRYEDGKVISVRGTPLTPYKTHHGYCDTSVTCSEGCKLIRTARVVCWLVHGPPPSPYHVADHINRVKDDDRPENLRWVSRSDNNRNVSPEAAAARVAKLKTVANTKGMPGERHGSAKLNNEAVKAIRESQEPSRVLAQRFNVCVSIVRDVRSRRRWKHI